MARSRSILRRHWPVAAVVGLFLATLVLRLVWGEYARRKLGHTLAALREAGTPLAFSDVRGEPLADEENAASILVRAADLFANRDSPRTSNFNFPDVPPYDGLWMTLAGASEQGNAGMMSLLRTSRPLRRASFGPPAEDPSKSLAPLNRLRNLANITADGALYRHINGDDEEAVERLLDVFHVAASIRQHPLAIHQLVAGGIEMMGCDALLSMAPGLNSASTTRPAKREQVRGLIDRLLDERSFDEHLAEAMRVDRLHASDLAVRAGERTWFLRPLVDLDLVRLHQNHDVSIAAARRRDWPTAKAALAAMHVTPNDRRGRGKHYFEEWTGDYTLLLERIARMRAERRLCVVALAMHLHRAEHGRFPVKLEELVPRYIASLPSDPFHADGRPIGYVVVANPNLNNAPRPLLFFDPGGANPVPALPTYSWVSIPGFGPAAPRQYRDLTRWSPPPPGTPATRPTAGPP